MASEKSTTKVLNLTWSNTYVHPSYSMNSFDGKRITTTGWLKVFELIPQTSGDPEFHARWDEKADSLDIDIDKVNRSSENRFNKETNGYKGHHPPRESIVPRAFKVEITIPGKKICEGIVAFNLFSEMELQSNARFVCEVVEKYIPGGRTKA